MTDCEKCETTDACEECDTPMPSENVFAVYEDTEFPTDCEKCDGGPAPSKSVCDACEESRHDQIAADIYETMGNPVPLSLWRCPRCECDVVGIKLGSLCSSCATVKPDPAREAQTDRRIHDMQQIHQIEMSMTDLQRREWIMHGRYIQDRDRGESVGFGLGEK